MDTCCLLDALVSTTGIVVIKIQFIQNEVRSYSLLYLLPLNSSSESKILFKVENPTSNENPSYDK